MTAERGGAATLSRRRVNSAALKSADHHTRPLVPTSKPDVADSSPLCLQIFKFPTTAHLIPIGGGQERGQGCPGYHRAERFLLTEILATLGATKLEYSIRGTQFFFKKNKLIKNKPPEPLSMG